MEYLLGANLCWVLRTITRWTGSLDFCVRHNLVFSPTTTCPERMVQFLPHNAGIHTSMKPEPEPRPFRGQSGRASEGKKDSRIYLGFAGLILILSYCELISEWPLALPRTRSVFSLTSNWAPYEFLQMIQIRAGCLGRTYKALFLSRRVSRIRSLSSQERAEKL